MTIQHGKDLSSEEFAALAAAIEISFRKMIEIVVQEKNICPSCTSALMIDVASSMHDEYDENNKEKEVKDVRH